MLTLRDFFHLPELDALIDEICSGGMGVTLVAGPDPRSGSASSPASLLSSGRSAMFQILIEQGLEQRKDARCAVITEDKSVVRVPRGLKKRVEFWQPLPPYTFQGRVELAVETGIDLLVIDRLTEDNLPTVLWAGRQGLCVLTQIDTIFHGAGLLRILNDLGASEADLEGMAWVLAVQRIPALCPNCKEDTVFEDELRCQVRPEVLSSLNEDGAWKRAKGCPACAGTGRHGDVAVFDVYRHAPGRGLHHPSRLPQDVYLGRLAALGFLPPEDLLTFEGEQLHQTFSLLRQREKTWTPPRPPTSANWSSWRRPTGC